MPQSIDVDMRARIEGQQIIARTGEILNALGQQRTFQEKDKDKPRDAKLFFTAFCSQLNISGEDRGAWKDFLSGTSTRVFSEYIQKLVASKALSPLPKPSDDYQRNILQVGHGVDPNRLGR